MFSNTGDGRRDRGARTRGALIDAAVRSFRDRGYEATTIRLLAAEIGVSVGSANYHFPSKADLVQELYLRVQEEHAAAATAELQGTAGLADRLRVAYETGLSTLEPYHAAAPEFLTAAMSPRSSINPLSAASSPARDLALQTFRDVVSGTTTRVPAAVRDSLPDLAFLAYLLLALFWAYDDSPRQRRTRKLLEGALGVFEALLPLLRLPVSRPLLARTMRVLEGALPWTA